MGKHAFWMASFQRLAKSQHDLTVMLQLHTQLHALVASHLFLFVMSFSF